MKLVLVLALASCTPAMHRAYQTAMVLEITATIACDYGQTAWMNNGDAWGRVSDDGLMLVEANPLLGKHPSSATIAIGSLAGEGAVLALSAVPIPDEVKSVALTIIAALETENVFHNMTTTGHGLGWCGR